MVGLLGGSLGLRAILLQAFVVFHDGEHANHLRGRIAQFGHVFSAGFVRF